MGFKDLIMNLVGDNEDDYDEFYGTGENGNEYIENEPETERARKRRTREREYDRERDRETRDYSRNDSFSSTGTRRHNSNKVVNIHTTTQLQVVLANPEKYEEAPAIADNLAANRAVVLNLENTNRDTSRRLLDFLSGAAYASKGLIKKVSNCTYLITPYTVDVMGDLLDELENNGMFM